MINVKTIANLSVGLYFIAVLYYFIFANIISIVLAFGLLTGVSVLNKIKGRDALIFVLLLILIFWSLVVTRFNDNSTYLSLFLIPAYFVALNIKYNFVWQRLFIFLFYLFYCYILLQIFQGNNINDILERSSRNYVGVILLIFLVTHYMICIYRKNNIILIHAILMVIISFVLYGRANIIISLFLLIILVLYKFPHYQMKSKITFVVVTIILAFSFIEFYQPYSESIKIANRFNEKGLDSGDRPIVFWGYIDKINYLTVMSGVSLNQYPFTILDGNPHNSYLSLHSYFGILSLSIFYFILSIIKKMNIYSFLLGLILLRAFTDTIIFVGVFDYLWIFVLLISTSKKRYNDIFFKK